MTPRKSHTLEQTKSSNRPSSVLFFDTETSQITKPDGVIKHRLRLGVAVHARTLGPEYLGSCTEHLFRSPSEFWPWVDDRCRLKSTTYLTAHNIVFDLVVLDGFRSLSEQGWSLSSFYTKGLTSIFRWSQGSRKLIAIDNGNLFPGSLANWGAVLGLPKLSVDFDSVQDPELLTYCRRDVEIMVKLWQTWLRFLDVNDCGAFKITVGSTAFNTWRYRFMPDVVHIHNDPLALDLERKAYRGARVEVLYQGRREDGPFYYLDVNNMYGYVLARYLYPCGLMGSSTHGSINILLRKLQRYAVVADCLVSVGDNFFPYSYDGHICYPLGEFIATLTTPEILLALESGWLLGVGSLSWYRQGPLFSSFVKTFSSLRQRYKRERNTGYSEICKLFINSLYGKFGQQGFNQKIIGHLDPSELWSMTVLNADTGQYSRHVALAGTVYEETKTGEAFHSFPAIAAHVTAYARLYLYRLARLVPSGHVFYMDTDSLIVDQAGYAALEPLMDNNEVGKLKVELTSPWVEINAPKDYAMEGRRRLKGIRPDAIELSQGVYKQDQWLRFDGMLQAGDMDGYTIRPITKRQRRTIHSGVVQPGGWVAPFVLGSGVPVDFAIPDLRPIAPPEKQQPSSL